MFVNVLSAVEHVAGVVVGVVEGVVHVTPQPQPGAWTVSLMSVQVGDGVGVGAVLGHTSPAQHCCPSAEPPRTGQVLADGDTVGRTHSWLEASDAQLVCVGVGLGVGCAAGWNGPPT